MTNSPLAKKRKVSMSDRNSFDESDKECVNAIRILGADCVQAAKSGHPGAPMGCAPMAHVLWTRVMNFSAKNPSWANRDRFVLSNGHASALQYTMLHLCGYDVSLDDLKKFRQVGSKTPGHPENFMTSGVEVSTGPLGQGLSNAVGMAIAREHVAARFNRPGFPIMDNNIFVICGDGCLQEGVTSEASSLAGHLGLGSLILLYDDNEITIDGSTNLSFTEDVGKRYESYGWHVQTVEDGNDDLEGILRAVEAARAETTRPSIIKVKTCIGRGAGAKEGTHGVHGAPLGEEILAQAKSSFGFDPSKKFDVPAAVAKKYAERSEACAAVERAWNELFASYEQQHPALGAEFRRRFLMYSPESSKSKQVLPAGWNDNMPKGELGSKPEATRSSSGKVLSHLAAQIPDLLCGSADLTPSNKTGNANWGGDFQKKTREGRYIRFGVREHAMAALCNGMYAYGGVVPACATFLNFLEYAFPAVRLSALSKMRVLYVMTHDSIGQGEDGPTHQPVEAIPLCRATPNLLLFRPADSNEVAGAYEVALAEEHTQTPSVIALSRQNTPVVEGCTKEGVRRGAYVVSKEANGSGVPALTLVGTGTEVAVCCEAKKLLLQNGFQGGVRVVSMPCWKMFERQEDAYKRSVFVAGSPTLAVEAAGVFGWERYSHGQVGVVRFGVSGKGADVMKTFGFSAENVARKGKQCAEVFAGKAWDLMNRVEFSFNGSVH
eukprot:g5467.t1